jgi:VCBS repeat-containing protein
MYRIFLTTLLFIFCLSSFGFEKPKKPKIVGQNMVTTLEEQSRAITLSDLMIEYEEGDNDSTEDHLQLEIDNGDRYAKSGNTITPAVDFNGILVVPVQVTNGDQKSNKYQLQVEVTADNDPPSITGQQTLQTSENQPITLSLNDLIVSDPDNNYPDDFTMNVSAGANYSLSGTTITPDPGFNGTLSVPVTVNDGSADSNSFDVQITVNAVNDVPVITGQQLIQINEDQSLDFSLSFLTVNDADNNYPADFTFSISSGSNYTVSGSTIIPATNFAGDLSVPVTVNDGTANSDPFNVSVTVSPVNDAPVITGQSSVGTTEGQSVTISLSQLTVSDPDNNYPDDFTLTVSSGSNYAVSGNTITPSTGFSGTLTVPVTVSDGAASSASFDLLVDVGAVNDAPVITGQSNIQTNEDQAVTISLTDLTVEDPDNTYPNDFTLQVSGGSNYSVSGNTITPAAGFNGTLSVPVTVSDGSASSAPFDVQVTVLAVNNAPVITGQSALQTSEEQPVTIGLENLVVSDPDSSYPTGFTLSVSGGSNYSVSGNTVTPAENFNGTLSVPVIVNDGSLNSDPFNVLIQVVPQNDAPVITGQKQVSGSEDHTVVLSLADLVVTDVDNSYPSGFSLSIGSGTNYTASGSTITPAVDFSGTLTVPVTVSDGVSNSNTFNISIEIAPVNDAPVITGQVPLLTGEDRPIKIELPMLWSRMLTVHTQQVLR